MRILTTILLFANVLFAADSLITNIATWNHPTKKVFNKYKTPIVSLQLLKNKTYPVFSIAKEVKNTPTFWDELAKANGYWNFSVIDQSNTLYQIVASPKTKTNPVVSRHNHMVYHDSVQTSLGTVSVQESEHEQGFSIAHKGKQWKQFPNLFMGAPSLRVVKENKGSVLLLIVYTVTGYRHPVSEYQFVEVTASGCRFFPQFGNSSILVTLTEISDNRWIAGCIQEFVHGVDEDGVDQSFYGYTEYTVTEKSAIQSAGLPE